MIDRSENINELAKALCQVQGQLEHAKKSSDNPFFKSKYADLTEVWDVCRKPLHENNLAVIQTANADGNKVSLTTMLIHSSGQYVSSTLTMVAKDASPQAIGSCISYARRYSIKGILGVSDEDDDGEGATRPVGVEKAKRGEARPPNDASLPATGESVYDGTAFKGEVHALMIAKGVPKEGMRNLATKFVGMNLAAIEEALELWEKG
jgi:hypothetical protein